MSDAGSPPGLDELFDRYVEHDVLDGTAPDPEALCRDRPELLEPLKAYIRDYRRLSRELAPAGDLETGSELLHFRIAGKLGAGGMGQVYVAEDGKLGRRVALKVLSPEVADDPRRLERFRREARALAALNHPNIVTVHSVDEDAGFPRRGTDGRIHFLTMELVEGTTLSRRIPTGGMALERLFAAAIPIADALAAAHEAGITHRDLKPDNVMIDAKARVKVLDFGLAKRAPRGRDANAGQQTTLELTEDGRVLGTMPYMSPEGLMASTVDARSDIFSLGIILYEMATGERPFSGPNAAQLISSILRDTPESVTAVRDELPRHLGRIVRRCLEKDPERRYQSALDVRNELQDLWREIESGELPTASAVLPQAGGRPTGAAPYARAVRRWLPAAAAVATLAALAVGYAQFRTRPAAPAGVVATEPAPASLRSSLAVLHFDNLEHNPDLEWLRHGLSDLVVTGLSQSTEIDVLSTGRLYQILVDLDALDARTPSFELIQEVAERGAVEAVVRGSYARDGEVLRIAYTVEDAATGAILKSARVDSRGEGGLFGAVDEIAAAIRNNFEDARPVASTEQVERITTSSLEAWRYYSEGSLLHLQSKRREAIVLMEKAVEIDPDFALALADLGTFHGNLGHAAEAREYSRRAVALAQRLPKDQRYRIEGSYYGARWATLDRAIEAYREGLKHDPERMNLRNNLARRHAFLERYDEATLGFERLIAAGTDFRGTFVDAANTYAALGRFESGYRILSDFVEVYPDNWIAQLGLGWHLTEWGRLREAETAIGRAHDLRPREHFVHYADWRLRVLQEDWPRAEAAAAKLSESIDSFARWRAAVSEARNLLYQGRSAAALARLDVAAAVAEEPDAFSALALCWKAELLLQRGEPESARAAAEHAQRLGREEWPELYGLFLAAVAESRLGGSGGESLRRLEERWRGHPNRVEERQLAHLEGLLALARGETDAAALALDRAQSLLPPRGVEFHWHVYPQHVPIWYALGRAELAAGRDDEARQWLERVVASGSEHLEQPVPYVRSFFLLGQIQQRQGDEAAARRSFERFATFWRDGDLDREQVAEALAFVEP